MRIDIPSPMKVMPDKVVITIVDGTPGAVAILGDDGIPFTIQPLPNIKRNKLFDPQSLITHGTHLFPNVTAIGKVVLTSKELALSSTNEINLRSRSGIGYAYHLLRWLQIPTIIADPGWLAQYIEHCGGRSALSIVKEEFPSFFREAHVSEQCAQAAILGFIAVNNPDWQGLDVETSFISKSGVWNSANLQ